MTRRDLELVVWSMLVGGVLAFLLVCWWAPA